MPMGSWGMAWQAVARTQADIDLNLGARRPDRRAGWMRGISALALAAPGRAMPALAAPALAALLSLGALNVSAGPARAEQPDPPVTYNAGMGTADAPREAPRPAPLRSGGIDDAGDSEAGHAMHGIAVHVTTPAAAPSPAPATAAIAPEAAVAAPAEAAPQAPAQAITPAQANAPAPESPQLPVAATPSSPVPAAADARAGETPVSAPAAAEAAPVPQSPVAQALAGILAQPVAGGTKKEQEGLVAFYTERQDAPLFVDEHGITARGMAVLARLAAAAEDGLDPSDYAVAKPAAGADPLALARAELKVAQAALTYARHAQSGRFEPSRISGMVTPVREIPDPAAILATLSGAPDANAALAAFNPPHAGYKALKAQLGGSADRTTPAIAPVPAGPVLKPGARDARVPALRARFGVTDPKADSQLYDPVVVEAVKAFQESVGIAADGVFGPGTLEAANRGTGGPSTSTRADIIANMERWRWLPRDLGAVHVMVNIPEFMVRIVQDGKPIHETRVIVGKPETPTPLLTREMQYVVVNPAWNVPPGIARNEMMPLLRSNPGALARRGIQVVSNRGGGYSFRQAPGERNALGRIKFMFPNDHSVYLHDTPSRGLFVNDRRAYSHGCVRVNEPLKFGEVIFNLGLPGDGWSQGRISKMFGSSERYINLKQRFPVHIVYFNVFVDPNGKLVTREDLYGINAKVKSTLDLDDKRRLAASEARTVR